VTLPLVTRAEHGRGLRKLGRRLAPFARSGRALATSIPSSRDLFSGDVYDQGGVGSCAAHAGAGALVESHAAAGKPLRFMPSMDGLYRATLSLMRGAGEFRGALDDYGSDMAYLLQAIGLVGVKPMGSRVEGRFSDCSLDSVRRELTLSEMERDGQHLEIGAYELPRTIDAICQAIAGGYCVVVGTFVDMAFEDWAPGKPPVGAPDLSDPNGGGHAIRVPGYETVNGERVLVACNSWSTSWGDRGRFLASRSWVENPGFDFAAAFAVHTEVAS